jgi:hypothetical protein
MKLRYLLAGVAAATFAASVVAQVPYVPQVVQIGPTDLFQDVVGGAPQAQNFYATAAQMGTYGQTLDGGNYDNAIIGGDFSTNLFQRGTSVGSITTTATYTADRWIAWSGAATTLTVTQQTGATDIPVGYNASLRVNKGSGAGVVQSCIAQEVETTASLRFQGKTAELDFLAKAGSGFSAVNSNLQVSIVYGTGTDEGTSKLAFAFNGGGGGSSTWTGQTSAASNLLVPINTAWNRYTIAAAIPSAATEVAAIICYTPVGTGTANDWFEFTGVQLTPNQALTPLVGTTGVVLSANDLRAKSFTRRLQQMETALQQRYFLSFTEPATGVTVGQGVLTSTTTCNAIIPFPVTMRAAPVTGGVTFTGTALSSSTWRIQDSTTSTLATTFLVFSTASPNNLALTATLTTASTAGWGCQLQGVAGGSIINVSSEL